MKWNLVCVFLLSLFSASQSNSVPGWRLVRTLLLKGPTHHVQGIDFDAHTAWVSSVDSQSRKGFLQTFSFDSGTLLKTVEVQDGDRFHPGGIAVDGDSLWLPVAAYRAKSASIIQKRVKRTLKVTFQFAVADHIGCIAVTPR